MMKYHEKNVGEFRNELGNYYTYRKTTDVWALAQGFEYEIDVRDGVRFATIKKTVAIVCIDEDECGPVVEKWQLKRNTVYA